jgi:Zn-dependent metalloprotease
VALAVALPLGLHAVGAWTPEAQQDTRNTQIPSLSEPGEALQIRERSTDTGLVTFAASEGRGILVSVQANAPTETRARSFVAQYGASFGVTDQSQLRLARQPVLDAVGAEHVRFQQQHNNVPVVAAELLVHLRGSRVTAANGRMLPLTRMPDTTPRVTEAQASAAARDLIGRIKAGDARDAQYRSPRLEILNRGLLQNGSYPSHLAWFVEAVGPRLRQFIWVDAHTGGVVMNFSQLSHAKNRAIYDANGAAALPGTLKRIEGGGATGDPEEDALYDMLGATYDYFFNQHNRDSFNGAGGQIIASVDWFQSGQCPNAFWNGTQTAYCDLLVEDDVVHHEFTHGVTEFSAGLFYFNQSGALNESFSDVFGETVDLTDGFGNDTPAVRWQIGEDVSPASGLPVPLRDMMTPTNQGNPGKMTDAEFVCDPYFDNGGVHINSGINNHAYALAVDGGAYNGHTITGIGLTKAGKIWYRTLTTYLSSGSTFMDNYNAVNQSCTDLIGTNGITSSDCTQVNSALRAVEMNQTPMCATNVASPPLCANGSAPTGTAFFDNMETFPNANWTVSSTTGTQWGFGQFWGDGAIHAFGPATNFASAHNFNMASSVLVPANAYLHFEHAFFHDEFGGQFYDGGVIEYSTNGGGTWSPAGALIEAGQNYNGTLISGFGNPLQGQQAFVFDSYGFTGTRLNLSSLQGQSVRFRFRVGNDSSVAYYGWSVDNVRIYSCGGNANGDMILNGSFAAGGPPPTPPTNWTVFSTGTPLVWNMNGGMFNYQRPAGNTQGVILQQTGISVPAFTSVMATFTMGNTDPARKRFSVLIHDADFGDLTVCTFWLDPGALPQVYAMTTHTTRAWANATISIYAASVGVGGFYQLDNVMMMSGAAAPTSTESTVCIDPAAPLAGGVTSGELLVNGDFSAGTIAPWFTFGNIQSQLNGGVFEFFKLAGTPVGVLQQSTTQAMVQDQRMRATFQLGNSSGLRQRVTVLIHDGDFLDLHACTFFLPPGLPLSTYAIRTYATKAWTNAQIAVYPATVGTAPSHQWLRIDNVSLTRTTLPVIGTECYEPGDVPPGPGFVGKR